MAKAAIEAAEAGGRLQPGGTVVEYTAGTTGISLASCAPRRATGIEIVFSDAFSDEKRRMMRAFGARDHDRPERSGKINEALIKGMIRDGRRDQPPARTLVLRSAQQPRRDRRLSPARRRDLAADRRRRPGVSACREHGAFDPRRHQVAAGRTIERIHIVAVEPAESAVLSGKPSGSHKIEGIGIGFIPPLWQPELVNEILAVSTDEAKAMARRLAREEGIFAGTSTGANVVAAIRVANGSGRARPSPRSMVDSGTRYLSTDVYA